MKAKLAGLTLSLVASAPLMAWGGSMTVDLTVISDPPGAMLYANSAETSFGYTPRAVKYTIPKGQDCLATQPIKVRWVSGAESTVSSVRVCRAVGKHQQFVFIRTEEAPGVAVDAQFAIQLEQLRIQQQATAAAALWQGYQAIVAQRPRTCYSQVIGNQVFTNCY